MDQELLIRNGFLNVSAETQTPESYAANVFVATVISNLATYGYTVDRSGLNALMNHRDLQRWWKQTEPVLKKVTGADRNMSKYMVYKNFPREVLEMDAATQVFHQILIYHGIPSDVLTEAEEPRPALGDTKRLKVLAVATPETPAKIYANLQAMPNRWNDDQMGWADKLVGYRNAIIFADFAFKENAVNLAAKRFEDMEIEPSTATDVIRLAAGLSAGDISLREKVKLRHFKRGERQRLLGMLEAQKGLTEDLISRPGIAKRLMEHLRPGDYKNKYPRVVMAYDDLYGRKSLPFSSVAHPGKNLDLKRVAQERPGEYLRRFHSYYNLHGREAVEQFLPIMDRLTTRQLAGLRAYLRTVNERQFMIYPPKSIWGKAQVQPNNKAKITPKDRQALDARISQILSARLAEAFPEGVALDLRVDQVKLQTNDQKLAEYGRGTEFDIPANITFVRSASYWEADPVQGTTWYDNGWNFFDTNWKSKGVCAWDEQYFPEEGWGGRSKDGKEGVKRAAIFSGDPVNSKELKGRACQMADLYLDKLEKLGVRYAVWNVLCYSRIKFSEANEVLATLQMGENAEDGKVYEPSRAQMVFPLKSEAHTSYVAYLDLKRRKLIYMDVGFPGQVSNAGANATRLEGLMPAYVEYLDSLPTVLEVLQDAPQGVMPVLFDDANTKIVNGRAFVFRPERADNNYDRVTVTDLIKI